MFAALNNCAFVSTANLSGSTSSIDCDPAAPFCFLMDASMLGVGVGESLCSEEEKVIRMHAVS